MSDDKPTPPFKIEEAYYSYHVMDAYGGPSLRIFSKRDPYARRAAEEYVEYLKRVYPERKTWKVDKPMNQIVRDDGVILVVTLVDPTRPLRDGDAYRDAFCALLNSNEIGQR